MDSKRGTITARWVRAIAFSVGQNPKEFTIQMAIDVSSVNKNIVSLEEFI